MTREKFLQIRLTEKQHQELSDFCEKKGVTMSRFGRDAIFEKLRKERGNQVNGLQDIKQALLERINHINSRMKKQEDLIKVKEKQDKSEIDTYKDVEKKRQMIEQIIREYDATSHAYKYMNRPIYFAEIMDELPDLDEKEIHDILKTFFKKVGRGWDLK